MKKIKILTKVLLLCLSVSLHALSFTLAPLEYLSDNRGDVSVRGEVINNTIIAETENSFMNVKPLDESVPVPRSFLDALKISNAHSIDYLLYGFVEDRGLSIYGELKLFDREKKEIVKVFYASDEPGEEKRLAMDLVNKFKNYGETVLGLKKVSPDENAKGPAWSILPAAGYWVPLNESWYGYIVALVSGDLTIRLTPFYPGRKKIYFSTGLGFHFQWAQNQEGFEHFNLYTMALGLSSSIHFDPAEKHRLSFTVEPQFVMDYLVREALYDDTVKSRAFLFGLSLELEYGYRLKENLILTSGHRLTTHFVSPARLSYNPYIAVEFTFPSGDEKEDSL